MRRIGESELILNKDNSIYHLALKPGELAETIFLVGDPGRVEMVSKYFERIEYRIEKREFITHTGTLRGRRLSVLSTGIGTDNIDIAINECDAVFNIDFQTRVPKETTTSLQFIRLGTSGSLLSDLLVDEFLISAFAIGLDGLQTFYPEMQSPGAHRLLDALEKQGIDKSVFPYSYITEASPELVELFSPHFRKGITITSCGFYGPQGRSLRLSSPLASFVSKEQAFEWMGMKLSNFEMETSAIYLLCSLLGHQALSINTILANRRLDAFSQTPRESVDRMIRSVLDIYTTRR